MIELKGLELGPTQVWGSLRLVTLLKREPSTDLRLSLVRDPRYTAKSSIPKATYISYMPHACVARWSEEGEDEVCLGTQLGKHQFRAPARLYRRTDDRELAFLPLHLAMEGFLALHFKGPDIAWLDYHKRVRREDLGIRWENTRPAWYLKGLNEALRLFEFHPEQVGTLLYYDEALVTALVVSHPEDYARLHFALLEDFVSDTIVHYGYLRARPDSLRLNSQNVNCIADLQKELERAMESQRQFDFLRAEGILDRKLLKETVYQAGPFKLERFVTELDQGENHIGDLIVRDDGRLEYLKTYRLSKPQSQRAYLLSQLAAVDWDLERAAVALQEPDKLALVRRLVRADFGYLLNPELVMKAQRA